MTLGDLRKTAWPWFGGKADAAPAVWAALGDVEHYVEPFAGSLAVLLRRPHPCNRHYYSETVNDLDGLLVNAWRAMQQNPDAMAHAASWPVSEADLHARHLALVRWRRDRNLERLMGDPHWHDPVMAGYWAWGQSCWIGSGWCSGAGAWIVGADGRITRRQPGDVDVTRPALSNGGQGAARMTAREPGVARQVPFVANDGRGAAHANAREPGVGEFHPMTMPELTRWFRFLSARLRHVRIFNGDWSRAVTGAVTKTLAVRKSGCHAGVFLDPPYSTESKRKGEVYAHDDVEVAHAVRQWALDNGADPSMRIVLAGYDGEHAELDAAGWRCVEWFRSGFLRGGMGNTAGSGKHQQARERLWVSPHCLGTAAQLDMFAAE